MAAAIVETLSQPMGESWRQPFVGLEVLMNRKWKYVMLAGAGGVLLQLAGCGQIMLEMLISNIVPLILSQLVASAVA